ncbi:restriction endonuclease subunit S [Nocardia nepalensis]|uniref:restriction endonuclease subunit S n=1 Tax=Nocardia nepalensis TaxID=3375448 RepID=UPI003B67C568
MSKGWRKIPLATVARLKIETVAVTDGQKYRFAGVYNAGKGLFDRGMVDASATSYARLHVLRSDRIVMRKLTASEGPITVVGPEFDGYVVSPEFPTFDIDTAQLLPEYMSLICQRPTFWGELETRAIGSVQRRKRVSPSQLLTVPIPLPDLSHQRRIVDLITSFDSYVKTSTAAAVAASAALQAMRTKCFRAPDRRTVRLDTVAEVTIGRQRSPKHQDGEHMTPYLRSANVKDGRLDLSDVLAMNFSPSAKAVFTLEYGDVLISEGSASEQQVGASAVWHDELPSPVCFQNTLIRLRAQPHGYNAEFLYHWARWAHKSGLLSSIASGTNIKHIGSQRLAAVPVPVFTAEEQRQWCDLLDSLQAVESSDRSVVTTATEARQAAIENLLDGLHKIPDSYDTILS